MAAMLHYLSLVLTVNDPTDGFPKGNEIYEIPQANSLAKIRSFNGIKNFLRINSNSWE